LVLRIILLKVFETNYYRKVHKKIHQFFEIKKYVTNKKKLCCQHILLQLFDQLGYEVVDYDRFDQERLGRQCKHRGQVRKGG
jgi:hypothetical protein